MKSILVVDDSSFMRNRVAQTLGAAGFDVIKAENGAQALGKCGDGDFACIVTDLVMPEMDGIGFLQTLRERDLRIPVVVLTADIQQTTRARCEELGAHSFLNKPPDAARLCQAVQQAIAA